MWSVIFLPSICHLVLTVETTTPTSTSPFEELSLELIRTIQQPLKRRPGKPIVSLLPCQEQRPFSRTGEEIQEDKRGLKIGRHS